MKKIGIASIWMGWLDDPTLVRKFTSNQYSEDGEFLGSQFSALFETGYFDEDFFEADKIEVTKHLSQAIQGFTHDSELTKSISNLGVSVVGRDANFLIVIYDYEYANGIVSKELANGYIDFIGTFALA